MFLSIVALIAGLKSNNGNTVLEIVAVFFAIGAMFEIVIELFAVTTYLGINI